MKRIPVLVIQGGAGRRSTPSRNRGIRQSLKRILTHAYEVLRETEALCAVTEAVRLFENDPLFNAGLGSQHQADGRARLSASIMDGRLERFAAVINLEKIRNPILAASALLREENRVLAGEGAQKYARGLGLKLVDTRTADSIRRWKEGLKLTDTVGAVALDRQGNLASATSTGGRGLERPGRVSDSGMPVANFADSRVAISATGIGEEIIEEGLALKIATRVEDSMTLKNAFQKTFAGVRAKGRSMGAVAVDTHGHIETATTTEVLLFACRKGRSLCLYPNFPSAGKMGASDKS